VVARVLLTVEEGTQRGRQFVLDRANHWIIGRTDDCALKLSGGIEYQLVSRRHCELDYEAPVVTVRDLGSRNGTYVNGRLVGRRSEPDRGEDRTEVISEGYPLKEGDELRLGPVAFRVHLELPKTVPNKS
jgi:pSer/pThr/pTyr-binding forkhead associated (FHA) protein